VTAPIVATTPSVPAPALQTQTASLPRLSTEGQPDSSESEEDTSLPRLSIEGQPDSLESEKDTSQFVITPRSSAPDTIASVPPSDP
jgi:hypothetical protein